MLTGKVLNGEPVLPPEVSPCRPEGGGGVCVTQTNNTQTAGP